MPIKLFANYARRGPAALSRSLWFQLHYEDTRRQPRERPLPFRHGDTGATMTDALITTAKASKNRFAGALCGLAAAAMAVAASILTVPTAQAQQPIIAKGNAIVTGFSGTVPRANPAPSADPIDNLFIDLNGASMRLQDISAGGQPPQGQLIASPTTFEAKAGDVGQVFGIAMDDGRGPDGVSSTTPDIYLSASSAFGLQIVQPDGAGNPVRMRTGNPGAQWMAGQWGDATKAGTPGSIWKVNGTTGAISLFANVQLAGQPNSGPGLGNLTFHAKSRQIFVSDLSTGMIHRIDMRGTDLGYYDHGLQGRTSQGLAPIPDDPANRLDITSPLFNSEDASTWRYAPKGRMVWGVRANGDRIYYAVADGPQVWSISILEDGSFGNDPRPEIDVTGTPNNNVISDIAFDGQGYIYLAQRGPARGDYAYKVFAEGKTSALLRYRQDPVTLKWIPSPEEYAVGFPPEHRNTNGGVALGYAYDAQGRILPGTCGRMVWTTGELLRQGSGLSGPEIVHGLQGMDRSLVRPANVPPTQTYFTDYDGTFDDPDVQGHMGNVKIWQPCEQSFGTLIPTIPPGYVPPPTGRFNLTLTKVADPKDCVVGGLGYLCSYRIFITNTGTTTFAGPLTVDDWLPAAPAGATMTFSPMPPWMCGAVGPGAYQCLHPGVVLFPGQYTELDVVVDLPANYRDCYLDNLAQIEWPVGYQDANPSDDFGFASARIPNKDCLPPTGKKTNLQIKKYAKPQCKQIQSGDWLCFYAVVVTNTGPGVYNDVIKVEDTLPAGATATFVTPAPWSCAGGPPTYQCQTTPVVLNVGQSTAFGVNVLVPKASIKPDNCKVPNKVRITYAPGGSDSNTNPADDDAMAIANVPSERCLGKQTNLKIEKFAGPCERRENNQIAGYACLFGIRVTNTGPGLYNGNIVVDDTFASAPSLAAFAPQPPWNCVGGGANWQCTYPAAALAPGGHVDLLAAGLVPMGNVLEGQCSLKNTAKILAAVPGSPQNNILGDDVASATATINDPRCKTVPPTGQDGHVKIEKSCRPLAATAGLSCRITITNDGGVPLTGNISFADQGTWTDNGTPLVVSSATPDDPVIQCTGLPSNLVCTLPGSALPPGASHSVEIVIAGGNGKRYRNCATMTQPNRTPIAAIGKPSCAEGGTGTAISVQKTAPASCAYGKDCAFQVTLTNDSDSSFSGTLMVGDLMSLGGVNSNGVAITSISPRLNCDVQPTSLPFSCKVATSLAGHEAHTHTITVQMPDAPAGNSAVRDGLNCFMAVDALGAAPGAGDAIAAAASGPGNGPGYSCVGFKMEQPERCPGDLKRIGTQCKCPEGTRQGANYTCKGGNETPPPPPPPPPAKKFCQAPLVGTYPDCHCPSDKPNYVNGQCKPNVVKRCAPPQIGTYPNCYCPRGTKEVEGDCVAPPKRCIAPEVGNYPNCYLPKCPQGQTGTFPNCKPVVQKRCTPPMLGNYPNCYLPKCPQGQIGTFPNCKPVVDVCPRGQVKVDGKHCCPKGYTWDGKCYPPSTGGNTPPKCKGVVINGVCLGTIPTLPVKKVCPAPAKGYLPNCTCPTNLKWSGARCVPVGNDGPAKTPGIKIVPGIKLQQNLPNLLLKQGPKIN